MMPRALLIFVASMAACPAASAQPAPAGAQPFLGVDAKYAAASADRSQLEILARLPAGAKASDLEVTGLAKSVAAIDSVASVRPLSSHTVFAIDGSRSFLPLTKETVALISAWATDPTVTLDATHTAQFLLFGDRVVVGSVETSAKDLPDRLQAFLSGGAVGTTMLLSGLEQALEAAELPAQRDLRSVWLFTDGGDSSKGLTDENAQTIGLRAAASRVRLFTATTKGKSDSSEYLTRLGTIASMTGGSGILLGQPPAASSQLRSLLESESGLSLVRARLCGLPQGVGELQVALQYLPVKTSSTTLVTHRPAWASSVNKSCCDPTQCNGWRACTGNACEPKACASAADCGADAFCEQSKCTDQKPNAAAGSNGGNARWYVAGILVALAAIAAGVVALGRRREGPSKEELEAKRAEALRASARELAAAAPAVPAVVAPQPAPVAAAALEELPETHLVVQLGPPDALGKRFRLARRLTLVGSGASNQVHFNVASLSNEHAEFQLFPTGALFVRDLDSTNGVTVDGVRLARGGRIELKPGAQVSLGSSLRLEITRPGGVPERAPQRAPSPRKPEAEPGPVKKSTVFDRN